MIHFLVSRDLDSPFIICPGRLRTISTPIWAGITLAWNRVGSCYRAMRQIPHSPYLEMQRWLLKLASLVSKLNILCLVYILSYFVVMHSAPKSSVTFLSVEMKTTFSLLFFSKPFDFVVKCIILIIAFLLV